MLGLGKTQEEKKADDKKKFPIEPEVAKEQLALFTEYYEIDFEDVEDAEKKAGIKQINDKLIKFIRRGRLEIKKIDKGLSVIQTLRNSTKEDGTPEKIEYGKLKGKSKVAMGERGEKDYHGRMYALMASLSGMPESWLHELEDVDISCVECLGALFLSV